MIQRSGSDKLNESLNHIDELIAQRDRIEAEILQIAEPYFAQLDLIRTIPGMNKEPMTAIMPICSRFCEGAPQNLSRIS